MTDFEVLEIRTKVKKWQTRPGYFAPIWPDWLISQSETKLPLIVSRDYRQQYTGKVHVKLGNLDVNDDMIHWIHAVMPESKKNLEGIPLIVKVIETT